MSMTNGGHHAASTPVLLVSAREAARLLGICERHLWALTKQGEVPCRRVGRRVMYYMPDLERYASETSTGKGAA